MGVLLADKLGVVMDAVAAAVQTDQERMDAVVRWAERSGPTDLRKLIRAVMEEYPGIAAECEGALGALAFSAPEVHVALRVRRPLGRVFVDRAPLKTYVLHELHASSSAYRVVRLRGDSEAGKSFFLNSFLTLATASLHVDKVLVDLEVEGEDVTARDLFNRIIDEAEAAAPVGIEIDGTATPHKQAVELVSKLVGWRKAVQGGADPRPLWVVIDHLDKVPVAGGAREFVFHLARAAMESKVPGLRLFLVGLGDNDFPAWLIDEHREETIDRLTPDDLMVWLKDELDSQFSDQRLRKEANSLLEGGGRPLHRRIEKRVDELRAERAGGL